MFLFTMGFLTSTVLFVLFSGKNTNHIAKARSGLIRAFTWVKSKVL